METSTAATHSRHRQETGESMKAIMRMAHYLRKFLVGHYHAVMSMALKEAHKRAKIEAEAIEGEVIEASQPLFGFGMKDSAKSCSGAERGSRRRRDESNGRFIDFDLASRTLIERWNNGQPLAAHGLAGRKAPPR
ncbi:hypothetical protein ACFOEK_10800 [Litoribrevibacter euphylliae]|uniref:Uncharacterized protein n=1 Tax=Litoribrevibacter euphylliae TaxID=1834034 RepID=A0ABV7HCB5_9GAMM